VAVLTVLVATLIQGQAYFRAVLFKKKQKKKNMAFVNDNKYSSLQPNTVNYL